jgi:hypothetical protein
VNSTWSIEDSIYRSLGELLVNQQLTEEEMEREDFPWRVGLTPDYIQRAMFALGLKPSELTDMISGDLDDFMGINRNQEHRDFINRREEDKVRQ